MRQVWEWTLEQNTRHSTNLSCSSPGTRKVESLVREQREQAAFRAVNGTSRNLTLMPREGPCYGLLLVSIAIATQCV